MDGPPPGLVRHAQRGQFFEPTTEHVRNWAAAAEHAAERHADECPECLSLQQCHDYLLWLAHKRMRLPPVELDD